MANDDTRRSNGHRLQEPGSPFPRFERRREQASGWAGVELGGHEVVSRLHLEMRPGPEAAGEGRHALDRLEGAIDEEQLSTLRLLVTELITNSVRHAGTDHWISLDLDIYANALRVEVEDHGPGFEQEGPPTPHQDRPGGWGLCLVDRMSDRWGVALDGATRVWFEIDRAARGRFATAA
jgi:anti-sigma regulatory factor (Ser/Thr protein kinase)